MDCKAWEDSHDDSGDERQDEMGAIQVYGLYAEIHWPFSALLAVEY